MSRHSNYWRLAKGVDRFSTARGKKYYDKKAEDWRWKHYQYSSKPNPQNDVAIAIVVYAVLMALIAWIC